MTRSDPIAEAVEAACMEEHGPYWAMLTDELRAHYRARERRSLLAALPKIEATDAMRMAGYERMQLSSDMDNQHGADDIFNAMLAQLVKEAQSHG